MRHIPGLFRWLTSLPSGDISQPVASNTLQPGTWIPVLAPILLQESKKGLLHRVSGTLGVVAERVEHGPQFTMK
jgi:hypothetical protein